MADSMSEQEVFWSGDFGDDYIGRNESDLLRSSNISLFSKILSGKKRVDSVLEVGANIGLNLSAMAQLFPSQRRAGIEINRKAFNILEQNPDVSECFLGGITSVEIESLFDLVLAKGVLIHLDPNSLDLVYSKLAGWSQRYVLMMEYYSPNPVGIDYRGHSGKLFKRDFAGEFMDQQPEFSLVDYGFAYHRDPCFPQDDITWFLMERSTKMR